MKKIFWLLLLCNIFQNCSRLNQKQGNQGLAYQIEKINLTKEIPFRFKEVVCKEDSGRVRVTLELENPTAEPMTIDLVDWELATPQGTRSVAIRVSSPSLEIKSDGSTKLDFQFEPINSLKLFRETGLKGALLQSYQLLYKGKSVIDFCASEADYSLYKKDRKEPEVFFLSMDNDFKNKELTYLKTNLSLEKNDAEIHEQEILLDGVNLVFNAYHLNDTLVVKLKLINHSLFPVSIKPGAMSVHIGNRNHLSVAKHQSNEVTIPRSQRGYIEERYPFSDSIADQLQLNISSINFMTPKPVPLFFCEQISLLRNR